MREEGRNHVWDSLDWADKHDWHSSVPRASCLMTNFFLQGRSRCSHSFGVLPVQRHFPLICWSWVSVPESDIIHGKNSENQDLLSKCFKKQHFASDNCSKHRTVCLPWFQNAFFRFLLKRSGSCAKYIEVLIKSRWCNSRAVEHQEPTHHSSQFQKLSNCLGAMCFKNLLKVNK